MAVEYINRESEDAGNCPEVAVARDFENAAARDPEVAFQPLFARPVKVPVLVAEVGTAPADDPASVVFRISVTVGCSVVVCVLKTVKVVVSSLLVPVTLANEVAVRVSGVSVTVKCSVKVWVFKTVSVVVSSLLVAVAPVKEVEVLNVSVEASCCVVVKVLRRVCVLVMSVGSVC